MKFLPQRRSDLARNLPDIAARRRSNRNEDVLIISSARRSQSADGEDHAFVRWRRVIRCVDHIAAVDGNIGDRRRACAREF